MFLLFLHYRVQIVTCSFFRFCLSALTVCHLLPSLSSRLAGTGPDDVARVHLKALEAEFGLTHRTVTDLLERARKESAGASDMFPYTHLLNQRLDHEQKCRILTAMWRVAFADGNVDKYEEHLIRRVHELLHLDHSDFIAAKQAARGTQN